MQADLRTFADFGVHGCTVLTAVTAQDAGQLRASFVLPASQVRAQLEAIARDFPPRVIKIGMTGNTEILQLVVDTLGKTDAPVVCDPVLQASAGGKLFAGDVRTAFRTLAQRAQLLTPNIPEAEHLSGMKIAVPEDVENAARALQEEGAGTLLIKGGHRQWERGFAWDYWRNRDGVSFWLRTRHLAGGEVRGSGCTLAAALSAALALGDTLEDALVVARAYLHRALRSAVAAGGRRVIVPAGLPAKASELPCLFPVFSTSPALGVAPWEGAPPGLYPVVPSTAWVRKMAVSGVRTVQLRIKEASSAKIATEIRAAVRCALSNGVRLLVNDYWEMAIEHGAWGVHLGQEDLDGADLQAIAAAGLRLGISTHCWREIARARALRPSYIALGPVFPTTSKAMPFAAIGLEKLRLWNRLLEEECPCVAIGGIDATNAGEVLQTGVAGISMISAICSAGDWHQAVDTFKRLVDERVPGAGDGA